MTIRASERATCRVPMSLFDLENDPAEQHDVASQNGEVVARLKARYDQFIREFPNALIR